MSRKCHDKAAASCRKCEIEAREKAKRRQRDFRLDQDRQAKQVAYARKLAEIEDEIEHQKRMLRDRMDEQDRQNALAQKKHDLASLKDKARRPPVATNPRSTEASTLCSTSVHGQKPISTSTKAQATALKVPRMTENTGKPSTHSINNAESQDNWDKSESKDDWEWQKEYEGAENEALDSLMKMTGQCINVNCNKSLILCVGLESVKQEFLAIKAKVDTVVRQNVSLKGERFGAALLGNPGTGTSILSLKNSVR